MFQNSKIKTYLFTAVAVISLMIGCAAKKPFWGDPKSGIILEYRMPENQTLKYQNTMNMNQSVEAMGQEMKTTSDMDLTFSIKSKGTKNHQHILGVIVDDISIKVESPQGNINPDMGSVIGKSFDMNLSFLGKELNYNGAKKIKYSMGAQGERDISSQFQTIFPDMAGKPLKIGDTWTTHDTIDVDEGGVKLQMLFNNLNTLAGFETVDGFECAKVTAKVTGIMKGNGNQAGMDLEFEGDIEADDLWYFAYKKGLFIKQNTDSFVEANIAVVSQGMTLPMTMEMKAETKLLK